MTCEGGATIRTIREPSMISANPRHRPDAGLAIVVTQGNCSTTTSVYRQLIA